MISICDNSKLHAVHNMVRDRRPRKTESSSDIAFKVEHLAAAPPPSLRLQHRLGLDLHLIIANQVSCFDQCVGWKDF